MSYDNKYIAFLDILGFKERVIATRNANGNNGKDNLHIALNYMNEIPVKKCSGIIQHISDSIILSYSKNNFSQLLDDVAAIQLKLASYEMYLRGGITYGEIFDRGKNKPIYGPGIIDAYKIESKVAVYPRVVVSERALTEGKKVLEKKSERIKIDQKDEMSFINWKYCKSEDNRQCFNKKIRLIREHVKKMLVEYKEKPELLEKYQWLDDYLEDDK